MGFESWKRHEALHLQAWWRNLINDHLINGRVNDAKALFEEFDLDRDLKQAAFGKG
ncbi:MAG: hypothetical protein ACON4T_00225 [Synechococcus sp.]